MKLTEKELYDLPLGTKAIIAENEYLKIRGNEWEKRYAEYSCTNKEIALLVDKILIPTYTEYIPPKPILDEKEKEYLSYVIKPFRNKVRAIRKIDHCRKHEYIQIMYNDGDFSTDLKDFDTGTMYKGMELDREYSLEELGL